MSLWFSLVSIAIWNLLLVKDAYHGLWSSWRRSYLGPHAEVRLKSRSVEPQLFSALQTLCSWPALCCGAIPVQCLQSCLFAVLPRCFSPALLHLCLAACFHASAQFPSDSLSEYKNRLCYSSSIVGVAILPTFRSLLWHSRDWGKSLWIDPPIPSPGLSNFSSEFSWDQLKQCLIYGCSYCHLHDWES